MVFPINEKLVKTALGSILNTPVTIEYLDTKLVDDTLHIEVRAYAPPIIKEAQVTLTINKEDIDEYTRPSNSKDRI